MFFLGVQHIVYLFFRFDSFPPFSKYFHFDPQKNKKDCFVPAPYTKDLVHHIHALVCGVIFTDLHHDVYRTCTGRWTNEMPAGGREVRGRKGVVKVDWQQQYDTDSTIICTIVQ